MNQARPTETKDYGIRAKQGKGKKVAEPVKARDRMPWLSMMLELAEESRVKAKKKKKPKDY